MPVCISQFALQERLGQLNALRLRPSICSHHAHRRLLEETALRRLEIDFVAAEREAVRPWLQDSPDDATSFLAWFRALEANGPGQHDALFPWLETHASMADMVWFLQQEAAGEAGFDDLVALAQLKLPARCKLEMARNYWDEMGCGNAGGMHAGMLDDLLRSLHVRTEAADTVWEARALANLMCALASNRVFAYQAIGALGVVELTAPGRAQAVNRGLKRLQVEAHTRRYYAVHATLDVSHANKWLDEVIAPLVEADAAVAPCIAEGALLRLHAGARAFAVYRRHLWRADARPA